MIQIKIKSDSGFLPEYETEGSAGMDVRAFIKEPIKLKRVNGRRCLRDFAFSSNRDMKFR